MDNALMRYGTQAPQGGQNALMRTSEMERQRILQELIARGPDPEEMGPHPYIMSDQERKSMENMSAVSPLMGMAGGALSMIGGDGIAGAGRAMMSVPHPMSKLLGAGVYGIGRGVQAIGTPSSVIGGVGAAGAADERLARDNEFRERLLRQNGY